MSSHLPAKHIRDKYFFSSLEEVRQRASEELEACAKDERRTREYLHRTKLACSVILNRRVQKDMTLRKAEKKKMLSMSRPQSLPETVHGGGTHGDDEDLDMSSETDEAGSGKIRLATLWGPPNSLKKVCVCVCMCVCLFVCVCVFVCVFVCLCENILCDTQTIA
jgi:hypothetical protein